MNAESIANNRGFVTLAVMLATIMQGLDTTIANVSLPHMQGTMGATQDQISWVLTSYIVAAAIAMPLTGFISARIGRKRLFMLAVVGFTVASMLCGAAQNLTQIVAFRIMQPSRVKGSSHAITRAHTIRSSTTGPRDIGMACRPGAGRVNGNRG